MPYFIFAVFLSLPSILSAALLSQGGMTIDIMADDENREAQIYHQPGWVTNELEEQGIWIGNEDLDNLSKRIRVVSELVYPNGAAVPVQASSLRRAVSRTLGDDFQTDHTTNRGVLPFLHISTIILPSGTQFFVTCSLRLVEEVSLKRKTWANDFTWQAITWKKEKIFFSRKGRLESDLYNNLTTMTKQFTRQFLIDKKARRELDAELNIIEEEVNQQYEDIQRVLEGEQSTMDEKNKS